MNKRGSFVVSGTGHSAKRARTVVSSLNFISAITRFLLFASLMLGAPICRAENRAAIDPNKETVLVTIGDVNFDIPLGYFYEKTIWTNGEWPKPKKLRTVNRSMVIVAHMTGLRPWSPELDADFKSGLQTTRINIHGEYNPRWLESWMGSFKSLEVATTALKAPGLIPFVSTPADTEVAFLGGLSPIKPFLRIRCGTSTMTVKCEVMFDFENRVVVSYSIPITRLNDWKEMHTEVSALLTKLKTK